MTKKINRVVAYVLLLVAVLLIIYSNSRIRQENKRLQDNQTALMKRIQEQTLKDGTHKVEKERLLLARNELEGTNAELERELKLLKIKYSRLILFPQLIMLIHILISRQRYKIIDRCITLILLLMTLLQLF